jgi:hypothetical protein
MNPDGIVILENFSKRRVNRVRKITVTVMLLLPLLFTTNVNADFVLTGTGWTVSGLTDTDPGSNAWSLTKYGEQADLTFIRTGYDSVKGYYTDGIDPALGGFDAGDWVFSTNFSVTKLVDHPLTESAHIAFYLLASLDVAQILVNDIAVEFESKKGDGQGWFEIILDASKFSMEKGVPTDFTLDFVYSFGESNKVNNFSFGVGFDREHSSIDTVTPEPATMLILGLGIAGLGLARRRMVKS